MGEVLQILNLLQSPKNNTNAAAFPGLKQQ